MDFSNIRVCAFVGPSGTGKSYRAQMVAGENNIEFIIDDGLLIKGNAVVAGTSAKKAPTKVETVKHALFYEEKERREMQEAFLKFNPEAILILGTSDGMVKKIAANLGLPEISKIIYINDVATEEEMENARRIRVTEGKHVIPVPTFEIKKEFSGYLLDPLQIFKSTGKGKTPYMAEKSIIRPTFSYMGNFTISDNVFKQIIVYLANKEPSIYKVVRTRVDTGEHGTEIYLEVIVNYGKKIVDILQDFQIRSKKEIERLTAMNVSKIDVMAKGINMPSDLTRL